MKRAPPPKADEPKIQANDPKESDSDINIPIVRKKSDEDDFDSLSSQENRDVANIMPQKKQKPKNTADMNAFLDWVSDVASEDSDSGSDHSFGVEQPKMRAYKTEALVRKVSSQDNEGYDSDRPHFI